MMDEHSYVLPAATNKGILTDQKTTTKLRVNLIDMVSSRKVLMTSPGKTSTWKSVGDHIKQSFKSPSKPWKAYNNQSHTLTYTGIMMKLYLTRVILDNYTIIKAFRIYFTFLTNTLTI